MRVKGILAILLAFSLAFGEGLEGIDILKKEEKQLEQGNKEVIEKAKVFMRAVSKTGVPMITMKEGNKKVVLRINEYGYPETRVFEGKDIPTRPKPIETGTNIREVETNVYLVKAVVKLIATFIYAFSTLYFLVHAYRSFRDKEALTGLIDLTVWLIATSIMGKLLGLI